MPASAFTALSLAHGCIYNQMHPQTPHSTVSSNIRTVAELERSFEQHRSMPDLTADIIGGFSGSFWFVAIHAVFFTLWFLVNTGVLPIFRRFDPYPFILLSMVVSVEGVLLSTFVLMKQNRMQRRIDARDHLNLQIDLLSEGEITKVLQLTRLICERLEIREAELDPQLREMATSTSVDLLAEQIQSTLKASETPPKP